MFFHVSLNHFDLVLLAFVVLGLVSSVLSQEIGKEERLRNDLFCVEWDLKPLLSQSDYLYHHAILITVRVWIWWCPHLIYNFGYLHKTTISLFIYHL